MKTKEEIIAFLVDNFFKWRAAKVQNDEETAQAIQKEKDDFMIANGGHEYWHEQIIASGEVHNALKQDPRASLYYTPEGRRKPVVAVH